MKTALTLVNEIYSLVNKPAVKNMLDGGGIYKHKRPDGSRKKDIAVVSLPVSGDDLQDGSVNVNIHVPNQNLTINGQPDNSQPDSSEIDAIAQQVIPLIQNHYIQGSDIVIQSTMLMPEDQFNEHFLNIRLQIYSPNID